MTSLTGTVAANAQSTDTRDCHQLRIDNGWSRTEYRECRRLEIQRDIVRLDAEFAQMREWLQVRGLDVTDAGVIVDPEGRTLAHIEASNAALAAGNAELAAGNAALRAEIEHLELSIQTSRAEYRRILLEFERAVLQGS